MTKIENTEDQNRKSGSRQSGSGGNDVAPQVNRGECRNANWLGKVVKVSIKVKVTLGTISQHFFICNLQMGQLG